jgi:hypothetical protein
MIMINCTAPIKQPSAWETAEDVYAASYATDPAHSQPETQQANR